MSLPNPYKLYGYLVLIGIPSVWGIVRNRQRKRQQIQELLEANADLCEPEAQEIVEIAANTFVAPVDQINHTVKETLREAGQLRLIMGRGLNAQMYMIYHIDNMIYFIQMKISEQLELPPSITFPDKAEAEARLHARKHSFKIKVEEIVSARVELSKRNLHWC